MPNAQHRPLQFFIIDWNAIIDLNWKYEYLYTPDFFEKYKNYFPVSSLQQSNMWNAEACAAIAMKIL
jgi:hypothetical protein